AAAQRERRDEIEQDAVVIAGVERDALLRAGGDDTFHHVQRAVAVERRDLDRRDLLDLGEAAPEGGGKRNAADGGLQIESDQRARLGDCAAMGDELVLAGAL